MATSSLKAAIKSIIQTAIAVGYDEPDAEDYVDERTLTAMAMAAIEVNSPYVVSLPENASACKDSPTTGR